MSRTSRVFAYVSALSVTKQIVPFDAKVPGTTIAISELSSLTLRNREGNSEVTLVGDGGFLYHARLHLQAPVRDDQKSNGPEILEFHEAYKLEVPAGQSFIDAEGIGTYCPESPKSCTYIIGAEHDNSTSSGIYEYDDKGKLINASPFPHLQDALALLGFSDANQELNKGFEALTVSPDSKHLIFTTEGALKSETNKLLRRLVFFDIKSNVATMYKYVMQSPDHGISDVATLDDFGDHIAVLERNVNSSKVYHTYLVRFPEISFDIDLTDTSKWNPQMVNERFEDLEPLLLFPKRPFYDDTDEEVKDNYEGLLLVDRVEPTLLMVSDNNADSSEKTIVNMLYVDIDFVVHTNESPLQLTFGFYLLLLVAIVTLLCCFLRVARRRGSRRAYHDNIMDSMDATDTPSDTGTSTSNVEMSSTIRREEQIQLT